MAWLLLRLLANVPQGRQQRMAQVAGALPCDIPKSPGLGLAVAGIWEVSCYMG